MLAAVTGGRDHKVTRCEAETFASIIERHGVTRLRQGAARGVDRWCGRRAKRLGVKVEAWPAEWDVYGSPAAGYMRNYAMLVGPPRVKLLIVFPGNRGTAHCRDTARALGIRVVEVRGWKP